MNFDVLLLQLFSGLSLFTIFFLMAVGLAIVFGLMGVINMAHGELMAMGAYVTYVVALFFEQKIPSFDNYALPIAIICAFGITFLFGVFLERSFIRFLYNRPLDTLLATWGLSLLLQQIYRSIFGAQEVSVPSPEWLDGSLVLSSSLSFAWNRVFIIGLTLFVMIALYVLLYRTSWGLKVRAISQNREMSGAAGINTKYVDTFTFALGCGLAGIAGSVFTLIGSTNPGTGQLYIVDTFIVVVFGSVQSLIGTMASAFLIAQGSTTFEYLYSGSTAKLLILAIVIVVLYFRPRGLFDTSTR